MAFFGAILTGAGLVVGIFLGVILIIAISAIIGKIGD